MKNSTIGTSDYPLLEKHPELIKSIKGTALKDMTIENILNDSISFDDCKIHHDTLIYQAKIAEDSGNTQLGRNLRRAAELTRVPDDFIIKTYNSIRPYRASKDKILEISTILETVYNAPENAAFIREALGILEKRHQLKEDTV